MREKGEKCGKMRDGTLNHHADRGWEMVFESTVPSFRHRLFGTVFSVTASVEKRTFGRDKLASWAQR
jgi:hypothetical protein